MPLVALGTGASSFEHECDDPGPHPPFKNMTCYIQQAKEATKSWLRLGGSMMDMAQIDENMIPVAQAVAEVGKSREDVFFTSKVFGSPTLGATVECGFDLLQMLNTSYIDLLLLHVPWRIKPQCWDFHSSDSVPGCSQPFYDPGREGRQEAWTGLELLVKRGHVRAIGLSDFSIDQMNDILEIATVKPAVLQTHWAPGTHNDTLKAYCDEHNITIQAFGAVGAGTWGKSVLSLPSLKSIAAAHSSPTRNISTAQVVLRWSVQMGVAILAGTGNSDHMLSDLDIFNFTLTDAEMKLISALRPPAQTPEPSQIMV